MFKCLTIIMFTSVLLFLLIYLPTDVETMKNNSASSEKNQDKVDNEKEDRDSKRPRGLSLTNSFRCLLIFQFCRFLCFLNLTYSPHQDFDGPRGYQVLLEDIRRYLCFISYILVYSKARTSLLKHFRNLEVGFGQIKNLITVA